MGENSWYTNIIIGQVLDAPAISTKQLHNLALQSSLARIAGRRLSALPCDGLVVGANPGGEPLIWHFSGDISVDSCDKLVMKVLFLAGRRGEDGINSRRVFGLV